MTADEHLWTEKAEKEHELFSELLWKELHVKDVYADYKTGEVRERYLKTATV